MKKIATSALAVAATALIPAGVQAETIDLIGDEVSGYLSFSGVKATPDAAIADGWNFPYYENNGIYESIAVTPLSEDSVYAEEAIYTVLGKDITADNFATISAGLISYDESALQGVGIEMIDVAALSLDIDGASFSTFSSGYNTGSGLGDFPFNYTIEASNLTGDGLTFVDGVLASIDLESAISVTVGLGDLPFSLTSVSDPTQAVSYDGLLSITGNSYAFDLDVTQDAVLPPATALSDTRMVFNRAGTIAAVSLVPEPSFYAMFATGLALVGFAARRRPRS